MTTKNWNIEQQIKFLSPSFSLLYSNLGIRRLFSYFTKPQRNFSELSNVKERGSGNAAS